MKNKNPPNKFPQKKDKKPLLNIIVEIFLGIVELFVCVPTIFGQFLLLIGVINESDLSTFIGVTSWEYVGYPLLILTVILLVFKLIFKLIERKKRAKRIKDNQQSLEVDKRFPE